MAKQNFLDNFRIARNLFFHPRVAAGSTRLDADEAAQMIARAAIWLTPKSVNGFGAEDFAELGLDRQRELKAAVQEFSNIAQQVPPKAPATPEQLGNATVAFEKILRILTPYLPMPQDGDKVEEALKKVEFPPWVVNWDHELGGDQDDMPAVWINFYVDESCAPRSEFGRFASRINMVIYEALETVGCTRWPYIRVRTALEHKTGVALSRNP